jgi:PadR family transcriptional regulator PadR
VAAIEHDSQLLKGALGPLLLRLLADGDAYGYALVERVHAIGLPSIPDGSIYPALNRLERERLITSYLVSSSSGPARKYYRLTKAGERELEAKRRAWLALVDALTPLLGEQPAQTGT